MRVEVRKVHVAGPGSKLKCLQQVFRKCDLMLTSCPGFRTARPVAADTGGWPPLSLRPLPSPEGPAAGGKGVPGVCLCGTPSEAHQTLAKPITADAGARWLKPNFQPPLPDALTKICLLHPHLQRTVWPPSLGSETINHRCVPCATPPSGREEPRPQGGGLGFPECRRQVRAFLLLGPRGRACGRAPPGRVCGPAAQTGLGRPETQAARRPRGPTWCSSRGPFSAHQKPRLSSALWAAR